MNRDQLKEPCYQLVRHQHILQSHSEDHMARSFLENVVPHEQPEPSQHSLDSNQKAS